MSGVSVSIETARTALDENGFVLLSEYLDRAGILSLYRTVLDGFASGRIGALLLSRRIVALADAHRRMPEVAALLAPESLATLAEDLSSRPVRCIGCQLIVKPTLCPEQVYWHRDAEYAPTDRPDGLTFWLPLNDVDEDNGCLWYIPGSHRPDDGSELEAVSMPMAAGDLAIHLRTTLHRSGPNRTETARCALMFEYIPDGPAEPALDPST